jgi:hypothetical protein
MTKSKSTSLALPSNSEKISVEEARKAEPTVREPDALALAEIENNHAQATHHAEQGSIGHFLGSRSEKPGNVAFIVIIICFLIIVGAFWRIDLKQDFDNFMKFSSALFAIITGALGYLFGSGTAKKK